LGYVEVDGLYALLIAQPKDDKEDDDGANHPPLSSSNPKHQNPTPNPNNHPTNQTHMEKKPHQTTLQH
jgi:hypothetical protein